MQNEWIIDVLGDLRAFAADNHLTGLAQQMDEALVVAALEIAQGTDAAMRTGRHEQAAGEVLRAAG